MLPEALRRPKTSILLIAVLCIVVGLTLTLEHFRPVANRVPEDFLALLAITFAVVQFLDARREETALKEQTEQMHAQAEEMTSIALSMSTRFAGAFPDNLDDIIAVVRGAKHDLKIIVDFVGYGQYSAPSKHSEYLHQIEHARSHHVEVHLICYSEGLADVELQEQFPDAKFSDKDPQRFKTYFEDRQRDPVSNYAELREILKKQNHTSMDHILDRGASLRYHHEPAAFFLWLADASEAVFAFKNIGRKEVGLSFRTRDGNLVRQLEDIFQRRWDNARTNYRS